jgi:hypothetical protein
VVTINSNSEGEFIVGASIEKLTDDMDVDRVLSIAMLDKYNSMFGNLLEKDSDNIAQYEHAFFDLYIYALAATIKIKQLKEK